MASISVIIPVFNSLSTLRRCVESVLSQDVADMEVILVDDGSTDGSSSLCDTLAAGHDLIRVIHRPNGGLSAARNTGIESASGQWLSFVDSDDELAPGTLKGNLEYAMALSDTDLVEFPVAVHWGSPASHTLQFVPFDTTGPQVFTHWIESGGYNHCYACNKLFRATLFEHIRFPLGESFEDAAICPAIIKACRTVRYSDIGCYLYYQSEGSITLRYRFHNQEPLFRHNIQLLDSITRDGFGIPCRIRLWSVCLNLLIDLARCTDADRDYIKAQASKLNSLRPRITGIHSSGLSFRNRIKVLAATLLGTMTICSILSIRKYK